MTPTPAALTAIAVFELSVALPCGAPADAAVAPSQIGEPTGLPARIGTDGYDTLMPAHFEASVAGHR